MLNYKMSQQQPNGATPNKQTTTDVDPSQMSQPETGVPDFLKLTTIPVNYSQSVETDLLEPVVFDDGTAGRNGFARWTLQNKGFLHSHSKLFIGLTPATAMTDGGLPANIGIGSVIKTAVFKIGNQTLNEISDWNQFHAVKSAGISNENNKEREQYTTGRVMNNGFRYTHGTGGVMNKDLAEKYGIDNGREYNGQGAEGSMDLNQKPFSKMDGGTPAESPVYSVDLSDLFPFLKVNSLPLYMINQPINIELTWEQPNTHRGCVNGALGGANLGTLFAIDRSELKFCADYIFYSPESDAMERYASQNKDLSFSFVDYRLTRASVDATAQISLIRNIGMASRIVPRIVTAFNNDALGEQSILNKYASFGPSVNASGVTGAVNYNVRYNDRYEYTTDVTNTARLFSQLTDSESVPFVTRDQYAGQGGAGGRVTNDGYRDVAQDQAQGGLSSKFFFIGTRLTNGRVGQRGIEIHLDAFNPETGGGVGPTVLRCWAEYLRMARLVDGNFEVYNA
jgi:hypothetical protein